MLLWLIQVLCSPCHFKQIEIKKRTVDSLKKKATKLSQALPGNHSGAEGTSECFGNTEFKNNYVQLTSFITQMDIAF